MPVLWLSSSLPLVPVKMEPHRFKPGSGTITNLVLSTRKGRVFNSNMNAKTKLVALMMEILKGHIGL